MKIIVCMKQVPATSKVEVDPVSGSLIRGSADTKTNPYDLYGLETALRIREKVGGTVTVLTMGPEQAKEMIRDAYAMGADRGVILSDRKFAGSDVLATSYTLSQGIRMLEGADLIICGKQTTDGDTAQIGPAIAEHLTIPHAAWVNEICEVTDQAITVRQNFSDVTQKSEMKYPCLITVDKDIVVPRLPSYRKKRITADKEIEVYRFTDLPDKDLTRCGLIGSPTSVERMFPPEGKQERTQVSGTVEEQADAILEVLKKKRFVG